MTPAEINLAMPRAWGDRELSRFQFRAGLFARRGFAAERAEHLADRLALRDMQGDDRRVCMECANRQVRGTCFKRLPVSDEQLVRCHGFEWQKP